MGRPAKTPSADDVAQVAIWRKAKVSIEEMARRLGMTAKTFRKHFVDSAPVETVFTPRFTPTIEQRQSVLILAGARISHPEIARKVGVTPEVLQEHFADELRDGPGTCRANGVEAMYHAMLGGNVAAAKVYLTFNSMEDAPEQPAAIGLKGKKEVARITAQTAERGTAWEELVTPGGKPN